MNIASLDKKHNSNCIPSDPQKSKPLNYRHLKNGLELIKKEKPFACIFGHNSD